MKKCCVVFTKLTFVVFLSVHYAFKRVNQTNIAFMGQTERTVNDQSLDIILDWE